MIQRLVAGAIAAFALAIAGCSGEQPAGELLPSGTPALYEIADKQGAVEGWLFGTIHSLPDGTTWRTEVLDQTLDRADLLIVEVGGLADADEAARVFAELSHTSGLPPLTQRVSAAKREQLQDVIGRSAFSESDFAVIETWAAALMLAQVEQSGDPANGVDRALEEGFGAESIRELEGREAQLTMFDQLPEAEQRDFLSAVLDELPERRADPFALVRLWLAGDLEALRLQGDKTVLADPELRAALLVDRNTAWTQQLDATLSKSQRPFIAVGAAHLPGEDGLVSLLEKEGYSLSRIQ